MFEENNNKIKTSMDTKIKKRKKKDDRTNFARKSELWSRESQDTQEFPYFSDFSAEVWVVLS